MHPWRVGELISTSSQPRGDGPPQECNLHINLLEMKAVLLALHAFQDRLIGHSVGLMSDTTTVVAYVNKQGGTVSSSLYLLARQVLMWTEAHSVTLVARYIPGSRNVVADQLSRKGQVIGTVVPSPPRDEGSVQPGHLRISSVQPVPKDPQQSVELPRTQDDLGSALLSSEGMVSRPSKPSG